MARIPFDPSRTGAEAAREPAQRWSTPGVRGLAYSKADRSELVDSSAIARIGFGSDANRLVVTFNSGRSYAYFGVSPQTYGKFAAANSKGRFFNANIRDKYAFRRLG